MPHTIDIELYETFLGRKAKKFSYEELTMQRIRVMKHSLKCSEDGYINRKHVRKFLKKRTW